METKEKKGFKFYWGIINLPLLLLVIFLILIVVLGAVFKWGTNIAFTIISWGGAVVILGFNGFRVTRKLTDEEGKYGALSGALTGVFGGLLYAVFNLIFNQVNPAFFNSIVDQTIRQLELMGQSMSRDLIVSSMRTGFFINLVISPIIYGIVGAVVSGVSALIFRKK